MPRSPNLQTLTTRQFAEQRRRGALVLDTRPAEQFAALHIRGSIQISLMGHFAAWAAILIDPKPSILLIAQNETDAAEAQNRLARVGLNHVLGYSLPNETEWRIHGIELGTIATALCANILAALEHGPSFQLVDVRSRAEWLRGHLPGAISMPLLDIDSKAQSIDSSKPSLVYCHEGFRATTAASILLRDHAGDIGILIDGVEGWSTAGLPLEMP